MRRIPMLACALLLTTLAAGGAHAQSPSARPAQNAEADERFLRFEDADGRDSNGQGPRAAIIPEPATLGMILVCGAGLFYPRRRGQLYR